jgi:hypothetical protein
LLIRMRLKAHSPYQASLPIALAGGGISTRKAVCRSGQTITFCQHMFIS